jgi:proline iminopeptidase
MHQAAREMATTLAHTEPLELAHARGSFLSINGAKLWHEEEGAGEPVLLIAGGPGASHTYMHGFSPLSKEHRLIYFDALGCGKSEATESGDRYSLDRAVQDVEALRIALKIPRWNVIGHSYGGLVAQAYAIRHPRSVTRAVLANTLISGEAWQAALDYTNEQVKNQCPEVWELTQELRGKGVRSSAPQHQRAYDVPPALCFFFDGSNVAKTIFEINQDVYYGMTGEDGDFRLGPAFAEVDFRPHLQSLTIPLLVIAGRFDRILSPRCARQFKQFAPRAELVIFEKSGHLPFVEEPAATFKLLNAFLTRPVAP